MKKALIFSLIVIPALVTAILGIRTNGIGLGAARKTFWILGPMTLRTS
ncbi:MAG: hypothetical protein HOC20_03100 [Chloroflexi bacterium]|nr:hypothetical protein [Chloroflexota bacterium]